MITPILKVYDFEGGLVALIDDYKSFYCSVLYQDIGEFNLEMSTHSKNFDKIKLNSIIVLDNERNYMVQEINIEGTEVKISGLSLSFILGERVVIPPSGKTHTNASSNNPYTSLVNLTKTCFETTDENRNIAFSYGGTTNTSLKISYKARYKNLLDCIKEICIYSGFGFKVLSTNAKTFSCNFYEGRDMSKDFVFSPQLENILTLTNVDSNLGYKNYIYMAGRGEGTDRAFVEYAEVSSTGWFRREAIKDGRNNSEKEDDIAVHIEDLKQTAKEHLAENSIKTSREATIKTNYYNLMIGDIVSIYSPYEKKTIKERIVEINYEYTKEGGEVIGIVTGSPLPTLKFNKEETEIE